MPATALRGANGVKSGKMPEGGNLQIQTSSTMPDPPPTLLAHGKDRWTQFATILLNRKVWSTDWIPALEHLCREYDNLAMIDEALNGEGETMLVPSTNGRTFKCNPLMEYRLKIEAFIQSQLMAFGLTPMSAKGIYTQQSADQSKAKPKGRDKFADPFDDSEE